MKFRLSLVRFALKYGVTKAAIKYRVNRQFVYRWINRYDGIVYSMAYRSRKPHSHPNQHTDDELSLIANMRRRNPNFGLVVFWVKLRMRGYTRSISGLYRILIKQSMMATKPKNPKYIPKPYEQMSYQGQRVQIYVKHVPAVCLVGYVKGQKFYQYTAIDKFSRLRFLMAFKEASTHTSKLFIESLIKQFPFDIKCVQTDNGFEFINRFGNGKATLFENTLRACGIEHKLIKPFAPRHNGKVERSHRKDNEYFYATKTFYSFDAFKIQLKRHNRQYNRFPMRSLGWISRKETLENFLNHGVTYV